MDIPSISSILSDTPGRAEPQKTICIVGAGPVGLAALKAVLDSEQYRTAKWIPIAFEAREDVGGIWLPASPTSADPPLTPLYDSLTTNLPHPVMAYTSFSFPPSTPLFPHANVVLKYLNDYTSHFNLRPHIRFNTRVTSIEQSPPNSPRRWSVRTSSKESLYFDLVIICNGHYAIPRYPPAPGLGAWINAHKASHSIYYRHPIDAYKDKTVLIVGGGPSGQDLVSDLKSWAKRIIHSGADFPNSTQNGVELRGRVRSFGDPSERSVTFADGTAETGIDYCLLATGYRYTYPFFSPPLLQEGMPPAIPPIPKDLYNSTYSLFPLAEHIWPLQSSYPPASLAFLGLLVRVSPFPLVEVQARAVLRAFDTLESGLGPGIDEQAEAVDIMTRWEHLRESVGEQNIVKRWHRPDHLEQFDYRDHLSEFAETDPTAPSEQEGREATTWSTENARKEVVRVKDWEKEMFLKKDVLRRTWVKLEKSGEAEEWVKGVGEGGIDEWVELMRKVLKYGEEEESKARL